MIRITELKLPLDHNEQALPELIVKTLSITSAQLLKHTIYKRSYDARTKSCCSSTSLTLRWPPLLKRNW